MAIIDLNDSQSLNSKKPNNSGLIPAELTSKIAGVLRLPSFRETFLVIGCFLLLITLLQLELFPRALDLQVGQPCKDEIYAPRDVIDPEASRVLRQEAVDQAVAVAKHDDNYYLIDETVSREASSKLSRFFENFAKQRAKYPATAGLYPSPTELPTTRFQTYFTETPNYFLLLRLLRLTDLQYQEVRIKSNQILMEMELEQRIASQSISKSKLALARIVNQQVAQPLAPVVTQLLGLSIHPNLILDGAKVNKLEKQVAAGVPVVVRKHDEVLIAKDQIITENDLKMLEQLHLIANKSNRMLVFFSLSFVVLLLFGLGLVYISQFHHEIFSEERMLYLLLLLLLLIVGLVKVFFLAHLAYLAPISFFAILVTILINPRISLVMTTILSLLGGIIADYNLALTLFYFVSGMISILALHNFTRQRDLVRCGWILMVANAVTVIALNLLFSNYFNIQTVLLASANGFLSAVLAIGSLPFLEHIFKITSSIRLLELANPGNPLLRRLQIEAPGTYHHSIMVGNLAEAAAEGIKADALWVRVGSYYHDIGKIKRPYFFVENQFAQDNPHERLNPSLSTLIITYHVKEGAEIAREHGLPDKLIEIIEQHHGTDLVRYFYKRATETVLEEKEALSEEDFRYEGPKPRSKEAALVMLADSVEAAVKSLPKPTPLKIETLVQKIIRERLDDGQFDECDLTLKDLNNVKNSFLKVLGGLFHNRIEYPENVLKEIERKKGNADSSKQPATKPEDQ